MENQNIRKNANLMQCEDGEIIKARNIELDCMPNLNMTSNMDNQEEDKTEILDDYQNRLMWFYTIQTTKNLVNDANKTEDDKKLQEELLKRIKVLEEQLQERLHNLNKELTFCQTMICILSAKNDE